MSHFRYGDQLSRKLRVGICLRKRDLPERLSKRIRGVMRKTEYIDIVRVAELRPNNQVLLEVWTDPLFDHLLRKKDYTRFVVYGFVVDEDPEWICEGDVGRGYVNPRKKGPSV